MMKSKMLAIIKEEIECAFSGYSTYSEIYNTDIERSAESAAERVLEEILKTGIMNPQYVNPKFKGATGKGDFWDYLKYLDDHPEHYYTHKNKRPEYYIEGWEPENEEE